MTEIDRYGREVERVLPERPEPPRRLTPDEISKVLDLVVAYTRREPDTTMVEVWATQSAIGRWTFEEAARAIHLWGANRGPNDFLEPSDVTRAVRAERRDRVLREEAARASEPGDPAAAERIREVVDGIAQSMGWSDSDEPYSRNAYALQVPCPHCGSGTNVRCVTTSSGTTLRHSAAHPARVDALARVLRGEAS